VAALRHGRNLCIGERISGQAQEPGQCGGRRRATRHRGRHDYQMVALVSQDDLAFLRKHRPGPDVAARRAAGVPDILEHPENMPLEEVERIYKATKGTTSSYIEKWRGKAYILIKLRTGKLPDDPPFTLPSDLNGRRRSQRGIQTPRRARKKEAATAHEPWLPQKTRTKNDLPTVDLPTAAPINEPRSSRSSSSSSRSPSSSLPSPRILNVMA